VIEPEARQVFSRTIQNEQPAAVVTFNNSIFNLVATDPVDNDLRLKAREVIRSQIKAVEKELPIYLTYPTGWRYELDFR